MTRYLELFSSLIEKGLRSFFFIALTKHPIIIVLTLISIVIFWSFPSYDVAILLGEMEGNWNSIFLQVQEPFTNHNHLYHYGSHSEKLAFRFVPALMMKALGIKTLIPALIFQFFTLIFFYIALTLSFIKIFRDKAKVLLYSIPICLVVSGHVYCSDYRGIFDTLALTFLITSLLFKDKPYVILFLLLAYFTDERAIIASPALILIALLESNKYHNLKSMLTVAFKSTNKFVLISWIFYLGIRYGLSYQYGLETRIGTKFIFFDQINHTLYTFYIGLEGFIIPLIFILVYLIKKQAYTFSLLIVASYAIICIVAQSVHDISRSMSYTILFIIFTLVTFDNLISKKKVYPIILIVIIICAVYDDYYPLLAQVYRMIYITQTL